jgi:hypothetical protein
MLMGARSAFLRGRVSGPPQHSNFLFRSIYGSQVAGNLFTAPAQPIGPVAADRWVIVAVNVLGNASFSSAIFDCSVGEPGKGAVATQIARVNNGSINLATAIFAANVTSTNAVGTTADIVFSCGSVNILDWMIGWWSVNMPVAGGGIPAQKVENAGTGTSSPLSIPTNGFAVGVCAESSASDLAGSVDSGFTKDLEFFSSINFGVFSRQVTNAFSGAVTFSWVSGNSSNTNIVIAAYA